LDHGNAGRQFRAYCAAVGDAAGKIGPVFNKDSVLVGSDKAAVLDAAGKRDRIDVDTGRKVENRAAVANAVGETPPTTIPTAFPALPIRAMTPLLVTPPAKLLLSIT